MKVTDPHYNPKKYYTNHALWKKNPREKEVAEEYVKKGFYALAKGWPDFIFYKDDGTVLMVEVKKKRKTSPRRSTQVGGAQAKCHEILRQHGFEVIIEYR